MTSSDKNSVRCVHVSRLHAEDAGFDAVMVSEHVVLGQDAGSRRPPLEPARLRLARQPGSPRCRGRAHWCCCPRWRLSTTRLRLVAGAIIPAVTSPALAGQETWRRSNSPLRGTPGRPADGELASVRIRRGRGSRSGPGARCSTSISPPGRSCGATPRRRSRARTTASRTCSWNRSRSAPKGRSCGSGEARSTTPLIPPHREVRTRLRPARASDTGGHLAPAARDGRFGQEHRGAGDGGRNARRLPRCVERGRPGTGVVLDPRADGRRVHVDYCIKPSQFIDDADRMSAFCREVVERVAALVG